MFFTKHPSRRLLLTKLGKILFLRWGKFLSPVQAQYSLLQAESRHSIGEPQLEVPPLNLAPAVTSLPAKNVRTPNETVNNNVAPPNFIQSKQRWLLVPHTGGGRPLLAVQLAKKPVRQGVQPQLDKSVAVKESFTTVQDWLLRSLTQARICLFLAKHSFRRQVVRRTGISRRGLLCKAPEGTGRLRKVLVGALWIPKRALTPLSW
jgi:hypothetical protein